MSTLTERLMPATPERRAERKVRRRATYEAPGFLTYGLLFAFFAGAAFPLWWSFVIGSRQSSDTNLVPPAVLPGPNFLENAFEVFATVPFLQALLNSLIISTAITISVVFFSTLAGYSFAKLRFPGSNIAMGFVVATMAVPTQLAFVPLLKQFSNLGLTGTRAAVVLPFLVTAFGVFFMRQYLLDAIPDELIDAARVDGCSQLRTFWTVAVPAARPAMAVLALFTFMHTWTDFMWPLLILQGSDVQTLQTALDQLKIAPAGGISDIALLQAGTLLATIPLLLLFIVAGRQLVAGIMQGAVKG